jgi:flavin-dependent dehydrogenase
LRTLLLERRGPPRDKTCGGLVTNLCVDFVQKIFGQIVPRETQIPPSPMPVFVVPPSGRAEGFLVPHEYVLNVTRRGFDGWLAERAEERGARLWRDAEAVGFRPDGDELVVSVMAQGGQADIRTRYLIGADGIHSRIREQMDPRPLSQRAYYIQEYCPRTGDFEDWFYLMYRGDTSPIYAYVIPKEDLLCLGIGIHQSVAPTYEAGMARFKGWLAEEFGFRDLGARRREGYPVPFGGVRTGKDRVLFAGDAAGFCYPPTGEGITFAVQSGAAAASSVAQGGDVPGRYASEMSKVATWIEAAASRTLGLTDAEREARIRMKVGV